MYIFILYKRIKRFSCEYSVILTVLWNLNMHICISILIHSLFNHVLRCTITIQCTRIYVHMFQMRVPSFAEVKVLQQQNMLNVHHMHTWVCTVFKWNYEQHLYTHTLIPIINRFVSTNEPLNIRGYSVFLHYSYRKSLFRGHWNSLIRPSTKIGTPWKLSHPQYWKI